MLREILRGRNKIINIGATPPTLMPKPASVVVAINTYCSDDNDAFAGSS